MHLRWTKYSAGMGSSPEGISGEEAAQRLEQYGPNELKASSKTSAISILLAQFKNIFVIILLAAAVISAALGHGVELIAIAVIVLFAVLLGFVQEYRAENAIEALKKMTALTASAIRPGRRWKSRPVTWSRAT